MVSLYHQKWSCKLLGYDFDIEYKPGSANKVVDALSRIPSQPTLLSLSIPHAVELDAVAKEIALDPALSQIQEAISRGQVIKPGYSLIQGKLYYKNKLALPATSSLIPLVLYECHDSLIGGHSGVLKTLKRESTRLFWIGMKRVFQSYVAACPVCQQNKSSTLSPGSLLQPLPIPFQIWIDISLDFIEGLPKSEGVGHHFGCCGSSEKICPLY